MAKIEIDGLTEKMIDGLCRKWRRPETIKIEKEVEEKIEKPDPDTGKITKMAVTQKVRVNIPNPQSKMDFVKEYVIEFVTNEYRLVVREDDKVAAVKAADEKVKKEAKLK